jgi:hypothetical protein
MTLVIVMVFLLMYPIITHHFLFYLNDLVVLFIVMVFSLPHQIVATIAFPILIILWFVVANSCPPSPSWSHHLVIVVAMVIMVFSLLQPIATHYCPHHFMVLIIVMVFLLLINVSNIYTPLPSWSWWSCGLPHHRDLFITTTNSCHHHPFHFDDLVVLLNIMVFSLLQLGTANITFLILMILWAIHNCSFLIVANHYPTSPSWSWWSCGPIWCHSFLVVNN